MSSFITKAKHKETGEIHEIFCLDGYFGGRNYGYQVPDGGYIREEQFRERYEEL